MPILISLATSTGRCAIPSWRRIAAFFAWTNDYVRVLTLKELPSETRPLLLKGLLDIRANFHVVTEWHPVDNARARTEIAKRRRHHHNSKTSFLSNLQDRQNTGPGMSSSTIRKKLRSQSWGPR